jgi:hypothetical protein
MIEFRADDWRVHGGWGLSAPSLSGTWAIGL